MKKVIFCEVAWMKYYAGVSGDNRPMNGGKYIAENGAGGEIFNFTPYNHKCYGYVMHFGNELHIERYDEILKSFDEVRDMTVVWVASDGKSSKIVGWYENATMYRYWQSCRDPEYSGEDPFDYNFVANEKDCYLIDVDKRNFFMPRASVAGAGRGMGRSHVWYADSIYAQEEFIPEVMKYLNSVRRLCKPCYFLPEELEIRAEDKGQATKELLDEAKKMIASYEEGFFQRAMALANLAIDNDDCYDTRLLKAELFVCVGMYDEAEEEYKRALYYEETVEGMMRLMYIEAMMSHTYLAIELGEKIRKRKDEGSEEWPNVANNLAHLYIQEGEMEKVQILMKECEQEKNSSVHNWFDNAREHMEANKKQMKVPN